MTRNKILIGFGAIALVLLFFLFPKFDNNNSKGGKLEITISEAQQVVFSLIYVADSLGYFKDENLSVKYRKFKSGKRALQDMIDGNSDLATSFETPIIFKTIERIKLSIYTSLHFSKKNSALIARKDRGIKSIKDLVGKKIGLTMGTNLEYLLSLFIDNHKVKPHSFKRVGLRPSELPIELNEGNVDAILTWQPHVHTAQKLLGTNNHITFYEPTYLDSSALVGLKVDEKDNHEKIKRFLKALKRAEKFYLKNKKQALEIALKKLPAKTQDSARLSWPLYTLKLEVSDRFIQLYQNQVGWFLKKMRKEISTYDMSKQFSPRALKEATSATKNK